MEISGTSGERHKRRMVMEIASNTVFSTIDLKDAYYQVEIRKENRKYTVFEADGKLFQYKRMPFGVTNGVACFQRAMNDFIDNNNLPSTYAYLDNITICGKNQEDHDHNLDLFLKAAEKKNLQFNKSKCVFSTRSIKLLGYLISDGEIRPDPDRMQSLKDLPVPNDSKHLKQVVGLFSYYSKWIRDFSAKIKPLSSNYEFPMPQPAVDAFQVLKGEIEKSVVRSIDENVPFAVETDASNFAVAATLNQGGRPVAFFSRTLQN